MLPRKWYRQTVQLVWWLIDFSQNSIPTPKPTMASGIPECQLDAGAKMHARSRMEDTGFCFSWRDPTDERTELAAVGAGFTVFYDLN